MQLPIYSATPGLERYPKPERFNIWITAHRRIMREDPAYRQRFRAYSVAVVAAGMLLSGLLPVFSTMNVIAVVGTRLALVAFMFIVVVRQQQFMNRRISVIL